jgi:glutamine amidotransferase
MIHIADYGVCNVGSILNMCRRLGIQAAVAKTPADIEAAQRIILPGIGAFDAGMQALEERGFTPALQRAVTDRRVPVLGICLGMQLMAESSSEGTLAGLGWVRGRVKHFTELPRGVRAGVKFPHIGWNFVDIVRAHPVVAGLEAPPRFYFVHSYCIDPSSEATLALSRYGGTAFAAMIARDNIVGAQFHPEKSHRFGMRLLSNFANWQPEAA